MRHVLFGSLLLLMTAALPACSSCDDTGAQSSAAPCANVTCDPGESCVAGACRPVSGNNGENNDATNNGNNDDPADVGNNGQDDAGNNGGGSNNGEDGGEDVGEDVGDTSTADVGPCTDCARLEADPADIAFSIGMVGQTVERRILLLNTGSRSVDILDVQILSSINGFGVVDPPVGQTIERDHVLEFGVSYTAGSLNATTATIQVFTSIPSVLSIPATVVSKDGNTDPCIEVNPTRIGFGPVQRGQTRTRQVTVTNCGSSDLDISRLERGTFFGQPTPASFQWVMTPQEPLTLPAAGRATIDVNYAPGRAGLDVGYFNIHSNDAATPIVRVDLNGTAQPPPIEEQDLHIQLDWDSNNCDVDLHFLKDSDPIFDCPLDCFYANANPDWAVQGDWMDDPFLDTDNIQGFGPENINVQNLAPGTYRVFLHYYLDSYDNSFSTSTNATVRIYSRGVLLGTFGPQHLDSTGRIWDVARIEWIGPTTPPTVTPLGQLSTTSNRSCR